MACVKSVVLSHVTYEGRPETCWKTVLCLVPVTILPYLRSRRTHTNTKTKQNKLRRRKPRGVSLLAQNGCGTKPTHHRAIGLCERWGTAHQQAVMGSTETMSTTPTFFETGQKRAHGETVCSTAAPSRPTVSRLNGQVEHAVPLTSSLPSLIRLGAAHFPSLLAWECAHVGFPSAVKVSDSERPQTDTLSLTSFTPPGTSITGS